MSPTSNTQPNLSDENNQLFAAQSLHVAAGMLLISQAKYECDSKNIIIRNFIARSAMTLKGILALWDISDFQGAWILHRSLLDRMFHLRSIGENDEFSEFDDWSFYQQYIAQNKVKSDTEFKHQATGWVYELSNDQKNRARRLSQQKPTWKRPKAETVAKKMDMQFLYSYGYDYASSHVHPMANDGQEDFFSITQITPPHPFPSNITVINNSTLAATMIFQDAINFSSFKWKKITWTFLEDIRTTLQDGNPSYQMTFKRLSDAFMDGGLCEPTDKI